MKKCQECGYGTNNDIYKMCPVCGKQLEIDTGKRKYLMGLPAEDSHSAEIEMTYEEAQIVKRVLEELHKDASGWCGSCWIEV